MEALYSVIASLPVESRKVIYHGLTAESKAELWQIHLQQFAVRHALSEPQKAMVGEAGRMLSPAMFAPDARDPSGAQASFSARAKEVFGRQLAFEAFATLGPVDASEPAFMGGALGPSNVHANLPSDCSCAAESDWCWAYMSCGGGAICYRVDGCGDWWQYTCNGVCRYR